MPQKIEEKPKAVATYSPVGEQKKIQTYLKKRVAVLKDTKKQILNNVNFEEIMKEADREYQPEFLTQKEVKGVMLIQDEIQGKRGSRIVPISSNEGQEWRSNLSEPTLLVKIQTALSILVDRNPESVFKAITEKYKGRTDIAHALWKRGWTKGKAKRQLKLFIFDLAKYGWAIGRTYPRLVRRDGEILETLDIDHPENNTYRKVQITEFNDVYREKLDPYRTWIDDMTNLTDPFSMDDWYFEIDVSKDKFDAEFGIYANAGAVKFGARKSNEDETEDVNEETKKRQDLVTLGFYESKNKDLYCIWVPDQSIVLYFSPLPNDRKKLSCWWTYWTERDPRVPYGIGLYEILKHNKVMYDRLNNMTIDQLVMAIYPMLFYSGANKSIGDGTITVSPGLIKQKLPGTTIDQVKIDYDQRGSEGVEFQSKRIDENTGITPTLEGQVVGKTLGETLHAKDAALRRLATPLGNIAEALEDEAHIAVSWIPQVFSIPEVLKFTNEKELEAYIEETKRQPSNVIPGNKGSVTADFMPILDLPFEQDREGNLIESPDDRFFEVGKDIKQEMLEWEGEITVEPLSILAPSPELERQGKRELFNLVTPIVQEITLLIKEGDVKSAADIARPLRQVLESDNEDPENWLPAEVVEYEKDPEAFMKNFNQQQQKEQPLFVNPEEEAAKIEAEAKDGSTPGIPAKPSQLSNPIVGRRNVANPIRDIVEKGGGGFRKFQR